MINCVEITGTPLVQVGLGTVGLELIKLVEHWNESAEEGAGLEYVGLADSSGFSVNEDGFSTMELEKVRDGKLAGKKLSQISKNRVTEFSEAIDPVFQGFDRGVLIDVTDASSLSKFYRKAFERNWSVVVANKIPLTEVTPEEFKEFKAGRIGYEATVGAGLPVISTLKHLQRQGDRVKEIGAILSGSLSYILSEIENGKTLSEAVLAAKKKGFTEPNPVEDLVGNDVVRKGLILGRSLGMELSVEDVEVNPLVSLPEKDFSNQELKQRLAEFDEEFRSKAESAEETGSRLRYLARVNKDGVKVGLEELDSESPLAGGSGTSNVIQFKTDNYVDPPLVIQGPGAGPAVTAGGVLSEINSLSEFGLH